MKIKELLEGVRKSPSQYGGGSPAMSAQKVGAPNISTVDRSAPWTKAAIGRSYKRTKDFNELATDKEKFDFLYNLKDGKTNNRISINGPSSVVGGSTNPFKIQSYDPATGKIELLHNSPSGAKETWTGNTNDFKYLGRSKTTTSVKTYTFAGNKLELVSSAPGTARGRPTGPSKKTYTFPKLPW